MITNERLQSNKIFTKVITDEKESDAFFNNSLQLFDGITNESILVVSDNPGEVLSHFMERVNMVIAGGGIVMNEKDELLMIYRRGKWDLPKGKIELKEKIMEGAMREVVEETGVEIESVNKKPTITYHAYRLKGKDSLKETSWFEMKSKAGQANLIPQTEEDIEEVRWVKKSDLKKYKDGCYLLIWDLISQYAD